MHIGGITEGKQLAAIAEPFGIRTAFHGPGDVGPIGAAASAHVGLAIPNFGIQEANERSLQCGIRFHSPDGPDSP
jgi:mannonate dehydratase